jgi:hypothetical protein
MLSVEHIGTILFAIAVLHTFSVGRFRALSHRFRHGSVGENVCHLLGEVEVVFLLWAGILFVALIAMTGWHGAIHYIEDRNYTEPKFVLAIMATAATLPIIHLVDRLIRWMSYCLPLPRTQAFFVSAMAFGPLMGSFVTEPAAMTVLAFVLKRQFFDREISRPFKYAILGTLFVNVSIGGVLTNFAAPPVLMVAHTWEWSSGYMATHFGWKAAIACAINAALLLIMFWKELAGMPLLSDSDKHGKGAARMSPPWWVTIVHVVTLGLIVATAHHPEVFFGIFVFFIGFCFATREYQEPLKLRDALLVGGFLAGLVTLGGLQNWWLQPLIASLGELPLFLGCTALTAVTDNAALTYLGSQVEGLSESMKYALVAGAVTGGGLTVIANAPNPAGYSILNPSFTNGGKKDGISPLGLLAGAALPTLVAGLCLWFLP